MVSIPTYLEKHLNKLPILITSVFGLFCLIHFAVAGPHWLLQNGDVNYTYLLSGLDYWSFLPSGINDQPALTVKLWNAIVIGVLYLLRMPFIDLAMEQDVIINSELYLNTITLSVYAILTFTLYRFLRASYNLIQNKLLWLVAICSFFFSSVIFLNLWVNKPEPYLVIAGLWISILLLKFVYGERVSSSQIVSAILFAVFSKILIVPFILPVLLAIPRKQLIQKILPFGLSGLVIIGLVWRNELMPFVEWIASAGSHTGAYGSGSVGFYDQKIWSKLAKTLWINKILIPFLVFGIAYSVTNKTNRKIILGFLVSYLVFFLFILKMPTSGYFIVCYVFAPVFILLAFQGIDLNRFKYMIPAAVCLFMLARFGLYTRDIIHKASVANLYTIPSGIQTYYSSTKEYALFLANKTQYDRHSDLLHGLYPNAQFYWFDNQFYNFKEEIPHETYRGMKLNIKGTSNYVESDTKIKILSRHIDGINYHYEVTITP